LIGNGLDIYQKQNKSLPVFAFLEKYILEKSNLTTDQLQKIEAVCQYKRLRKRQYLLQEGDVWGYNAFVVKGCVRVYKIDEKGNESILSFAIENWWTGDRESLLTGNPSDYNIDALEDSEIILINKPNFEKLCSDIPSFNDLVGAILQNSFIASQRRIQTFLSLSAEERYLQFLKTYPQLATRIPQGMIASYLGMTPETLSRVRNQSTQG